MQNPNRDISVIVPTFREAENLPFLIQEIENVANNHSYNLELIIVDDDSQDGTIDLINKLKKPWVKLITRKENLGLSLAIIEGFDYVSRDIITIMDADLSHSPSSIPKMIEALDEGCDFAIGSRYVVGASTDESWGLLRWINSKVATLLALPLTKIKDPMSGFFAFKRSLLSRCKYLNPVGYKILLELLVKTHANEVKEIPIHFANRSKGKSKLTLKQQLLYLMHLRRLYLYKYAEGSYLFQFLIIGFMGVFVNLLTLSGMLYLGVHRNVAVMIAIAVSMISNFILNRRFTFSYARSQSIWEQFVGYLSACSLGALVNYLTTMTLIGRYGIFEKIPQLAALVGITAGTGFNYLLNRFAVFQKK